jgi:hypothetical protein
MAGRVVVGRSAQGGGGIGRGAGLHFELRRHAARFQGGAVAGCEQTGSIATAGACRTGAQP